MANNNLRIGSGFDVHAFCEGRPLIIGGVKIKHSSGLAGHSDADVLVHAIMDALLGAANLGDIGEHFPDTDECFRGADSIELLKYVRELLENSNFSIINIDTVIIAQAPKLSKYRREMQEKISRALAIDASNVGIKATTSERLGFVGREEGIAASAVALLEKRES